MSELQNDSVTRGINAASPGVVIAARRMSASEVIELSILAEKKGWSGVWLAEVLSLDASVLLGALTQKTSRIELGTAIIPVSTRSAALLAMMASSLSQLAPGRISIGFGVSTPEIVKRRHDRPVEFPLGYASGVIEVVREALKGERVDREQSPAVNDLRIEAPEIKPPLLLAALGPKMVELARSHADGLILNLIPFDALSTVVPKDMKTTHNPFRTILSQRVCIDPTPEDLEVIRREIASYCRVPAYAASISRFGWDLSEIQAAEPKEAAKALPDDLLNQVVVMGSKNDCLTRLRQIRDLGVEPLVVPVGSLNPILKIFNELDPSY